MKKLNRKHKGIDFNNMFLLRKSLDDENIASNLDDKNKIALDIMEDILNEEKRGDLENFSVLNYIEETNSVMKWMLNSALEAKDMGSDYCEVIDIVSIFLIKVYRDYDVLPIIVELIFERNKNNLYIHELVWVFFQGYSVESLKLICDKLSSEDIKTKELACNLLGFIPNVSSYAYGNKEFYAKKWIDNNKDYLYFTDESKHARSNPVYCKLNLEGKYLGEKVNKKTGEIIKLKNNHKEKLREFNNLDEDLKLILASYSLKLKRVSLDKWTRWFNYPLDEQISIAKREILI
ncbi:MAG: hypothetical protein Q4B63_00670 [Clostridium perfringens]|nr:hypothetical protein [Clostridium perfringens]